MIPSTQHGPENTLSLNRIAMTCLLSTTLSLLAGCGGGTPDNDDIKKALEEGARFELRQRMGNRVADIEFKNVAAKDCIAKGEEWLCRVDATVSMKRMRNGEMEPHEEKFSEDVKLKKTDSGWTVLD